MNVLIPRETSRLIVPLALALGLMLVLRGHGALGDGFLAAGVVSIAMIFRHLAAGSGPLERLADREAAEIVAIGLFGMLAVGLGGFLWSDGFLRPASTRVAGLLLSTSHLFELSIAVVIVGMVVAVVGRLGGEP